MAGYLCWVTWAWPAGLDRRLTEINGAPGAVLYTDGSTWAVLCLDINGDNRIQAVHLILNPDKLTGVR
ncbi:hypothetical protein [Nocardia jiangxiensis]|uniref:hypothetical protein n=1 Tax=Nocardia jiangxiensis TaxID=282685 RepID=UPI0002E420AF|nr:hypothetical protein [Nocardia jiangxiensis]